MTGLSLLFSHHEELCLAWLYSIVRSCREKLKVKEVIFELEKISDLMFAIHGSLTF